MEKNISLDDKYLSSHETDILTANIFTSRNTKKKNVYLGNSLYLKLTSAAGTEVLKVESIEEAILLVKGVILLAQKRNESVEVEAQMFEELIYRDAETDGHYTENREWKDDDGRTLENLLQATELMFLHKKG